ncbi:MAG: hypothetical protein RhofKO_02810 [Rhodothermales bacterium]
MGNTGRTMGESIEGPVHERTLSAFAMGTHEVTQAQFEAVMGYNPSLNRGPDLPVERVSWYDAVRFCNALSEREGLTPYYEHNAFEGYITNTDANGYRLPTEAEWEYAAKAGTTTDTYADDGDLDNIAWYLSGTRDEGTRAVGQKQPNAFGLYDIIGNVFEWTASDFVAYPGGRISDDVPGAHYGNELKIVRGGASDTNAEFSRATYRYRLHPSYVTHNVGFRVARSLSQ